MQCDRLTRARLEELLGAFPARRIGLLGDLFLDRYLELEPGVREFSLETGQEAYQVTRVRNQPGALGTVLNNLVGLGVGWMAPLTVIGSDGHGDDLMRSLQRMPIENSRILRRPERLTPTYTKPLRPTEDGGWTELNRIDVRDRCPISAEAEQAVLSELPRLFAECDGLIVLDQISELDWGVVNTAVRARLEDLAEQHPDKLIYVDSRAHLSRFQNVMLKGNETEFARMNSSANLAAADRPAAPLEQLLENCARANGRAVICTCGEQGAWVAAPDGASTRIPASPVRGPVDIVGAGDAFTSGFVAAFTSGATLSEAAHVGNLCAAVTVQQLGTTGVATPQAALKQWEG